MRAVYPLLEVIEGDMALRAVYPLLEVIEGDMAEHRGYKQICLASSMIFRRKQHFVNNKIIKSYHVGGWANVTSRTYQHLAQSTNQ